MLNNDAWNELNWSFHKVFVGMKKNGVPTKFIMKAEIDISLNDTSRRILYVSVINLIEWIFLMMIFF